MQAPEAGGIWELSPADPLMLRSRLDIRSACEGGRRDRHAVARRFVVRSRWAGMGWRRRHVMFIGRLPLWVT